MARITVEDCIKQVENQYDLVILAKERAIQLGRGAAPAVDPEDDKKPVIALREIGECKITPTELKESIIAKLRQIPDYEEEEEELDEVDNDTFRQMYQGGLSKSEMEKSATRKFTTRTPRIETKNIVSQEEKLIKTENDVATSSEENISETANEAKELVDTEILSEYREEDLSAKEISNETISEHNNPVADDYENNQLTKEVSEEQPSEEQPSEEQPSEEQPSEEQPSEEQPSEEQPSEEQPSEEQPSEEQPSEEQPSEETLTKED